MRRYHEDLPRTIREHWRHMREIHGWPEKPVACICDLQAGRFRKKDAFDCGHPGCLLCHGEKVLRRPSVKDRIQRDRVRDSLAEIEHES
jgi:hypothetical protein